MASLDIIPPNKKETSIESAGTKFFPLNAENPNSTKIEVKILGPRGFWDGACYTPR
jgi:hypothetical protein